MLVTISGRSKVWLTAGRSLVHAPSMALDTWQVQVQGSLVLIPWHVCIASCMSGLHMLLYCAINMLLGMGWLHLLAGECVYEVVSRI